MSVEHPHHDEGLTLAERIHATITQKPAITLERHIQFTGLLTETLVRKGILAEHEVISLLDKVITAETL